MLYPKSIINLNKKAGQIGEAIGQKYFETKGFTILLKNYKTRFGEIDLVLQKKDRIYFIEFKTSVSAAKNLYFERWLKYQLKNLVAVIKTLVAKEVISIDQNFQIELVAIDLSAWPKVRLNRNKYLLENDIF
jgi:putative endonuclease